MTHHLDSTVSDIDVLSTQRVAIVREAVNLIDAGDPAVLDLCTDGVELICPKVSFGHGKEDMAEFARRLGRPIQPQPCVLDAAKNGGPEADHKIAEASAAIARLVKS